MNSRTVFLLVTLFAVAASVTGMAQAPCGVPNQIYCQSWDGTGNLFASQNDTTGGFGNFATSYDHFTLTQTWDVESFHWVGGYFNPPSQGQITAWTLTFYDDNGGIPGNPIATGSFSGTGNETCITSDCTVNPIFMYSLFFGSFDMGPGTYWASVVPDLGFPPQWGWATSLDGDGAGYQCFLGTCGGLGVNFAFALDGTLVTTTPEPSALAMLGVGILGLAGTLRRKLF